jgi:hypothetical protein
VVRSLRGVEVISETLLTEPVSTAERDTLLDSLQSRVVLNPDLDRSLVSFQANRNTPFHSWFKYREGFSTGLVRYAIEHYGRSHGILLDPFAGSGTALFESRSLGWDSILIPSSSLFRSSSAPGP